MSRPFFALVVVAGLFVAFLGACWIPQPPSNQELLANYAKIADYTAAIPLVKGLPWWTNGYLQGSSFAFLSFGALTNIILAISAFVGGPYLGGKLIALSFLFLCPLTMFWLVRRLCPEGPWAAFSCGAAYLFAPAILIRLGHVEHVAVVLAFAMLPLAFLGLLVFLEEQTLRAAIFCAVTNGLLALAYLKITTLAAPLMAGFSLWVLFTRAHFKLPRWPQLLAFALCYIVLAVVPNLPAVREMNFVIHFDLGPFAGWQRSFSTATALSWLDRDSYLTGFGTSPQTAVKTPSAYLGFAGILCVAIVFFFRKRPVWQTPEGTIFRLFVALALLAQWLGFGVFCPLTGQLAFLSHAHDAADFGLALSWALLVLQAAAIAMIMPGSLPGRPWWSAAAIIAYFCIPAFRIVEKLPLYGDLRAPHDFSEIGGVFCFAVAAGLAAWLIVREIPRAPWKQIAALVLLGAAGADAGTVVPSFYKSPLDRATYQDFLATQDFLKKSPMPGWVFPYSGRYFYLLTPVFSGRGLVSEAYNSHLMSRGVAELQQASTASQEDFQAYLNVSGISHILLDKQDPDTPNELQEAMRKLLPVDYENEHFALLKNESALAPAAFARNYIQIDEPTDGAVSNTLHAAAQEIGAISHRSVHTDKEGLVQWKEKRLPSLVPIQKIAPSAYERPSPQRIVIKPPAETGWLLIPETFHPDWRAYQGGEALEIAHSFHGLIGVRVHGSKEPVTLIFQPPWWYPACVWTSLTGWIFALGFLCVGRAGVRQNLTPPPAETAAPASLAVEALQRVVVLIPTYNEASSIRKTLDTTLAAHPALEILVLDDASPDGTAALVREHPEFKHRVHLTERPGKMGLGNAYKAGFQWAREQKFDVCIEMDADLSHNPADIPKLLAALENGADVAIGSRYLGGVRVINWPPDRLFLSLGATKFVGFVTHLPLTDATSGFKAIRCEALKKLNWSKFKAEGYGFQIELHYFLWKAGAKLVEVPIVFTERREGKTKMTPGIAVEALARVLRLAILKK